jgi:ABC-type sugar transport system ATPase subunit
VRVEILMGAAAGHRLRLDSITHRFGELAAVSDVALDIAGGELVALLGPSGCGKSTLLRIMSGFIRQTQGRVLFDEAAVDHLPPNRRGVGIVFQSYALFPHMTVRQNIAYGLQAHHWARETIAPRVDEMLDLVHMRPFGERLPRQLSGGQQQRIALARCLAIDPKVLLLDEPFGALDKNLRLDMQIEVKRLHREYGITTVLVTHDQEEALSMADRIAVMNRGEVEQVGPPQDIYDKPVSMFVADFIGSPPMNFLHFTGGFARGSHSLRVGEADIEVPELQQEQAPTALALGVRPEHIVLDDAAALRGRVFGAEYLGTTQIVIIDTAHGQVRARIAAATPARPGEIVGLRLRPERLSLFEVASGRAVRSALHDGAVHG